MPENLNLKKGESQVLQFKGLATSGYEWKYTVENEKIISIKKEFVAIEETEKKLAGASAGESFKITGLQQGTTKLYFRQVRSWEPTSPINEKQIIVTVS